MSHDAEAMREAAAWMPTWHQISKKVDRNEDDLDPVEKLIYEHEPHLPDEKQRFRNEVAALIAYVRPLPAQQAAEPQGERERFEAWAKPHGYRAVRNRTGEYTNAYTNDAWDAWQAALATPSASPTDDARWISVEERLPTPGKPVIAHYLNRNGLSRTTRAMHAPRFTVSADDWEDVDSAEMNDVVDAYWWPEGWWEQPVEEEVCHRLDGTVTHWQPLPAPPAIAAQPLKDTP